MVDVGDNINASPAEIEILRWKKLIKKHEKCRVITKKYKVVKKTDIDKILHKINTENSVCYLTESKLCNDKFSKKTSFSESITDLATVDSPCELYKPPAAFVEPCLDVKGSDKKDQSKLSSGSYTNIRHRIFTPKKPFDTANGITDVDEKYFSIVKKRQCKWKMNKQQYINYLRESLRLRLQTGYIYDEIYKMNELSDAEKNKLNRIQTMLKTHKSAFNEFLAEDHNLSMKPLLLYADEVAETDQRRKILTAEMLEASKIQCDIYNLEEAWHKSKLCEEFLLSYASIISGNPSNHNYELKYGTPNNDLSTVEKSDSRMSVLKFVSPKAVQNDVEICLKEPSSLIELFISMEHQCLDYLTFTELLENPNKIIAGHLNTITRIFDVEIRNIIQSITKLSNAITFLEQSNENLEAHVMKLLHGIYKETYEDAEESILIREYIKQTYARCIGHETAATPQQMMNDLSLQYSQLQLEMDSMPTDLLRRHVKEVEVRDSKRFAIARKARRKIRELETLTDQMSRLYKPVVTNKGRKLMTRSYCQVVKEKPVPVLDKLTEEQEEYLYFFADYCPYSDNAAAFLNARFDDLKQDQDVGSATSQVSFPDKQGGV